ALSHRWFNISGDILLALDVLAGGLVFGFMVYQQSEISGNIDQLKMERKIQERSPFRVPAAITTGEGSQQQDTQISYFDRLVDINLTNLGAYYGMVKIHANRSFLPSLAAGAVGFLLIILSVLIGLLAKAEHTPVTYVSAISGVISEFISGVFFYLYNKTVRQLKEYH